MQQMFPRNIYCIICTDNQALNRGALAANSDHYPFATRHVPCIFLENENGDAFPYYHTIFDNWKTAVFDSYEPVFRLVTEFVDRY